MSKVRVVEVLREEINRLLLDTDNTFDSIDHDLPLAHLGVDSHGIISIFISLQQEAGIDLGDMGQHAYPKTLRDLVYVATELAS